MPSKKHRPEEIIGKLDTSKNGLFRRDEAQESEQACGTMVIG